MKPLVPRIYVKDASLVWNLMWIISYHPLPDRIRRFAGGLLSRLRRLTIFVRPKLRLT